MFSASGSGQLVAGRYRLLDQLGRGAMGIVWRGRDELLDRDVAVKQIIPSPLASATDAEASYERTLREARSAARLSHPGVVTIFDVVEEQGSPWIVMELIHARPLDQVVAEDGPLTPAQAAQLGLSLLDALSTAHAAGVLHRDVKPSNVLITPDGKAVLTDFGIATIQGDPSMTQAGMVVGTPGFSPPERVRGGTATTASDLWSLGATLYAAVEGRGPFDRAGGSMAVVAGIATEPAPRAPSAGPLAPVIDALLLSSPAERPDTAETKQMLGAALEGAQGGSSARRARGEDIGPEATTATSVIGFGAAYESGGRLVDPVAALVVGAGAASSGAPGVGLQGAEAVDAGTSGAWLAAAGDAGAGLAGTGADGLGAGLGSDPRAEAAAPVAAPAAAMISVSEPSSGSATAELAGVAASPNITPQSLSADGGGPVAATSVVPDLMATPVFADLRMPVLPADPDEAASSIGMAGLRPPAGRGGLAGAEGKADAPEEARSSGPVGGPPDAPSAVDDGTRPRRSRRSLALLTTAAVVAVVIIATLAIPGVRHSLLGMSPLPGASRGTSGSGGNVSNQGHSGTTGKGGRSGKHGTSGRGGTSGKRGASGNPTPSGTHGSPTGRPTPGQSHKPGQPSPSGKPSPTTSGGSPSPTPSSSSSASPSPSSSSLPPIPAGYIWQSESGSSLGTTAGFRIATPATWLMTPGLQTYFGPPVGSARLGVDLAPFVYNAPVREAKYLQAYAIANHSYHDYHLISILAMTYHGNAAATWTWWWKGKNALYRTDVVDIIFTAHTSAGPQPFILSMSALGPGEAHASHVMRVAMRTFRALPS